MKNTNELSFEDLRLARKFYDDEQTKKNEKLKKDEKEKFDKKSEEKTKENIVENKEKEENMSIYFKDRSLYF